MVFLFSKTLPRAYTRIQNENDDEESNTALRGIESNDEGTESFICHLYLYDKQNLKNTLLLLSSLVSLVVSLTLSYLVLFPNYMKWLNDVPTLGPGVHTMQSLHSCQDSHVRREWRTLTSLEKDEYISAVQCLRTRPATIADGSLYDDFPYTHKQFGSYSHKSAAFLPWHRYFIFLYENSLRKECGYTGSLPYWDWTLDWEDITQAPVFSSTSGFGGDGDPTGEITVGGGRCVIDGPFAGLEALRYDADFLPHCLSRGFLHGELLRRLCGDDIHPAKVRDVLAMGDFESFMHHLEEGPHIAISTGIRGDWLKFTVPYGMSNGS